jgi:hypothetical protein
VYRLTEPGQARLEAWMSSLLSTPVKEYPQFEAALSFMPVLHPDVVLDLLRMRSRALEKEIAEQRVILDAASKAGLPRVLLIEGEYHVVLREAELTWVRDLVAELAAGTLEGQDGWRQIQETGVGPEWTLDTDALDALRERKEGGGAPG